MPFEDAKIIEFLKHYAPIAAARLASLPSRKKNAMIERGVIDEASLWSQSLLFMVNICSLDKSGTYLPPACAKDMLE